MAKESISLEKPSQKLYFVRRRGMKYEPEREKDLRKIRKVEVEPKSDKIIKKRVKRTVFKQRGLTKVGEERKAIQEARKGRAPTLEEMLKMEALQKKAVVPSERQHRNELAKQVEEETTKEVKARAKSKGVSDVDKQREVLDTKFREAGFSEVPEPVLRQFYVVDDAGKEDIVNQITQSTNIQLKQAFAQYPSTLSSESEEEEPSPVTPAPAYEEIPEAYFDKKTEASKLRNFLQIYDTNKKTTKYKTDFERFKKLTSRQIESLANEAKRTGLIIDGDDFDEKLRKQFIRKQAQEQGRGLKFKSKAKAGEAKAKAGEAKRGKGRPKGSKNKPALSKQIRRVGKGGDLKSLIKSATNAFIDNPTKTIQRAEQIGQGVKNLVKNFNPLKGAGASIADMFL